MGSLIDDLYLLAYAFLVDVFEDVGDKIGRHAALGTLSTTLGEDLTIAFGLKDGHVVLLFVLANLATDAHALGQQVHELVVELVNLMA